MADSIAIVFSSLDRQIPLDISEQGFQQGKSPLVLLLFFVYHWL